MHSWGMKTSSPINCLDDEMKDIPEITSEGEQYHAMMV